MASFFRKCSMGGMLASNDWFKDDHSSKETLKDGSAGSNPSPKSPLDLDFEKETGVTVGLGIVPYLAKLWLEDPYDRRIVFGMDMGVDHFSRSLIEVSAANAFELISLNPSPPARLFSYSSTPSSLFSPISHTPLIGSQPDMNLPDYIMPLDPDYFLLLRAGSHEEDDQSVGSDMLVSTDAESENDLVLSECHGEYINDGSFGGMKAQMSQLAHEEEYTRVIARGANPKTTQIYDNSGLMEQPRRVLGGLSATFGVRANRPPHSPEDQYPTEEILAMQYCHFCKKPLNKEQNGSVIFKNIKYAYCSNQCRKAEVDTEEDWVIKDKSTEIGCGQAP